MTNTSKTVILNTLLVLQFAFIKANKYEVMNKLKISEATLHRYLLSIRKKGTPIFIVKSKLELFTDIDIEAVNKSVDTIKKYL